MSESNQNSEITNNIKNNLLQLIKEYGEDFLGDGTKERFIRELEEGNEGLAREIFSAINADWLKRALKIKRICIYSDREFWDSNCKKMPYCKTKCISTEGKTNIPALIYVEERQIGKDARTRRHEHENDDYYDR